jgi:hypothetical protein
MVLFRALGWLLLGMSIAIAVRDGLAWWAEGRFHAAALGDLWLKLDFASLKSLEAAAGQHFSPAAWARLAAPVLAMPALPIFVIAALVLLWFGPRRAAAARAAGRSSFLLASRPPRRRRSRSSLS